MSNNLNISFNPDILTCLANLSSDEVFTPPKIANELLDQLPNHVWSNENLKFLDPSCKSGVFLREITKRLIKGLEKKIPNLQKRIDHILTNQVYGIGITELTSLMSRRSLYCSKKANGKYSITNIFKNEQGNILYEPKMHVFKLNKCIYCGASQKEYSRSVELESYGYQFIHYEDPNKIFNMKFDVIIGNPPYQLSDGGHSRSASPIYQLFIEKAKQLNPRYLCMIIPSRWFIGGKGLDDFRNDMLNDKRIRFIADYKNSSDVFPGVDIAGGICYFLWDRDNPGKCQVKTITKDNEVIAERTLNEFEIFIRDNEALKIVKKIKKLQINNGSTLSDLVSSRKPFSLPTNYVPKKSGVPCWFIQKIGLKYANKSDVTDFNQLLGKWKLLIPKSPIAGQTDFSKPIKIYYENNIRIAKPGECCTESWIVAGAFHTEKELLNFKSYLFTKTIRFLILQAVVSQDITKKNFCFVPNLLNYNKAFDDKTLIRDWKISKSEWEYIDSKII